MDDYISDTDAALLSGLGYLLISILVLLLNQIEKSEREDTPLWNIIKKIIWITTLTLIFLAGCVSAELIVKLAEKSLDRSSTAFLIYLFFATIIAVIWYYVEKRKSSDTPVGRDLEKDDTNQLEVPLLIDTPELPRAQTLETAERKSSDTPVGRDLEKDDTNQLEVPLLIDTTELPRAQTMKTAERKSSDTLAGRDLEKDYTNQLEVPLLIDTPDLPRAQTDILS